MLLNSNNRKAKIAETIKAPAQMKKAETIAAWHAGEDKYAGEKDRLIEEAYRKTSFDGAKGEIISIAWAVEDEPVCSYSRTLNQSEAEMICGFYDSLYKSLDGRPPFFIGHYISGFDLKFLFQRCVILGVKPNFKICHSHNSTNLGNTSLQSCSLIRSSRSL